MSLPGNNLMSSRLAEMRRTIGRNKRLTASLRATRALVHFGPWRHLARTVISVARPPAPSRKPQSTAFAQPLDPDAIISALQQTSFCSAGMISDRIITRIRVETDALPRGEYAYFHEESDAVRALVNNDAVLSIARRYFRAEPVLLECTVVVQEGEGEQKRFSPQRLFHFDYAGWQSLNLFVYLTDVTEASGGAHQVVAGSQRGKKMRDLTRPAIGDEEIFGRFGDRVITIEGPAGTAFFENTEAFHRRTEVRTRRAMLNVLFASHRGVLSHGRLARSYRQFLNSR